MVVESKKIFFNSINSMFSNLNSTRSNSMTSISAHVKKESNFILKYFAPATPTQQYNDKQGCGLACFRAESEYFL